MKKIPRASSKKKSSKKKTESSSSQGTILSMGNIDLAFKIEFSDEDLIIKEEGEENKDKSYYNIEDFNSIKDLAFLKDRKEVWDKFILQPKNDTLEHLLLANILRKKQVITEYIGFGRPNFTDNEKILFLIKHP